MSIDRIRAGIVGGMQFAPEAFFDEGWRLATDDEQAVLACLPDDIVIATPLGGFCRLPLRLDGVAPKTSRNVRVLDDPDREANLARLREAMVSANEGGVTRWPDGGSDV